MTLKVGDRVRLTGKYWVGPGAIRDTPRIGDVVTITEAGEYNTAFEGSSGRKWYITGGGYEAELVDDASDVLDTLEAADIKAEHLERLERIVRDAKDKALNRWRSKKHPDYTIEAINHQTDIELKVRREGTAGFKSVDKAERTKPVGFTLGEWEAVREYRGDDDLPTEPGIYVPANNQGVLGHTFAYRLDGNGEWIQYAGPEARTGVEALERAIHAHTYLGGLVRLGVIE